jgi:hypothetical protein
MPRPGGEPLRSMAALWVASRRLPGMTQRNVLPIASILLWDTTAHRTGAPRDVPGSRLLLTHRAAMLRKRLPPVVGPFEDEDDYGITPDGPRSRYYRYPR